MFERKREGVNALLMAAIRPARGWHDKACRAAATFASP
jgi:hypothetical protein